MPTYIYPSNLKEDNIPYILFTATPYVTKLRRERAAGKTDPSKKAQIRLAIPPQLNSADSFNYETTSLLKSEAMAQFLNGDFGESAKAALAAAISEVGFDGFQQAAQAFTGTSINPKEELLFKSPGLRSHNFTFNMFARSKKEAENIKRILDKFRELIYPGTVTTTGSFYEFPNQFSISQQPSSGKNGFPRIPEAVCTSMDVNYAGGGRTILTKDDFFQAIDLTLTFQDIRTMTRETIAGRVKPDSGDA